MDWKINEKDRTVLRELAQRQMEAAHSPAMDTLRSTWQKHNDLVGERPMVLLESGGVAHEFRDAIHLQCKEQWARNLEYGFRARLYHQAEVQDDTVIDPYLGCSWQVSISDNGVAVKQERGTDSEGMQVGYHWDPPIKDLDRDFHMLSPRTCSVDREASLAWKSHLEEVFGDTIPIQMRGAYWWTMGMTMTAIYLIGLEQLMLLMYDNPEGIHRLMEFLRDDHIGVARWLESEGLLTLNNGNDYVGSGTYGFTKDLPQPDWQEGDPVRTKDLWVLLESQETVGISPEMFAEFIVPYQLELSKLFGLTYYGCCEPVHNRWESVRQLANLRSVSVSPWCDQAFMADALKGKYVYSRKPNPSLISTHNFDEDEIKEDLRETVKLARDCSLEIIMKDVHTLKGEPGRMGRWVRLARDVIAEVYESSSR